MFDSPMDYCTVCGEMVALDQTRAECAREHGCSPDTVCPLLDYFPGLELADMRESAALRRF